MTSIGIRIGLGLLASTAPLALVSAASASSWTVVTAAPQTSDTRAVVGHLDGVNLAQADGPAETSDAERVLLERARYWRGRNRPDLAIEALDRLLSANPASLQGLLQRGLLEASRGNNAAAQQYLGRLRSAHPGATAQIAQLERSVQQGQISGTEVEQARRLAQSGSFEQASRRYQQAFRGQEPGAPYALEYYQTLAGTTSGYEEGRRGLQDLAKSGDPQARLALARTLTYREGTRREGIRQLQDLSRTPAVATEATAAWRQALLWLGRGPQDRALYEAYLSSHPGDTEVKSRREGAVAQAATGSRTGGSRAPGPDPRARLRAEAFGELNSGDLGDAEAGFRRALQLNPSDPDALAGLGIVRLRQDRFSEARDLLSRAVRDSGAKRKYAEAYEAANFWAGMDDAQAAFDAGRYEQAENLLNGLLRRNYRDSYQARRLLGDVYARQGREDAAERQYQAVLQADPRDTAAMTGLFNVYAAQNRTQDALNLATQLESRVGNGSTGVEADTLRLRAKQYELTGEDNLAITAYQDAIVADPTDPWTRLDFARFLTRRGEQAQANAMIQSIVDTPGAPPEALRAAAIYYNEAGLWNESIATLDRIPPAGQTGETRSLRERIYLTAQLARARALGESGNTNEARRILEDLYRSQPTTIEKTASVAAAMADIGDARRAQSILRPLISGRNASPAAQLQFVSVLLKSGQEAEAAAYIRQLEQNPALTSTQRRELAGKAGDLAVIQADRAREAKNYADAYDILYPHLAQNPDSPNLLLALARLYATAGYPDEARSIYAAVLEKDPTSLDAVRGAVGAAIDARDYDIATNLIDRALAYHPREPRLYYLLGEVARARGDLSTARQALEAAQDLRQREVATTAAATGGRGLPPNPFRNTGSANRSRLGYSPAPVPSQAAPTYNDPLGSNPFRSSGYLPGPSSNETVAAIPESQVTGEQLASADTSYVSTAQATPRRQASRRSQRNAPVDVAPVNQPDPYATPMTQTPGVYVPPFIDPAIRNNRRPDNLSGDIQRSLAAVQRETGPSVGAGLKFRARDGDSGLDRLREFQAPVDLTFSPGGFGKLTFAATPINISAGSISSDPANLRRFGVNPIAGGFDPGDQSDTGVGLSLAYANGPFGVDAGVTPVGFEVTNFVGGASYTPKLDENIGLKFTVEQRSITDSVLSYAGRKAFGGELTWGGVVKSGGRAELNFDDGLVGAFVNAAYYDVSGTDVEDNSMVDANIGGYYRLIRRSDEELRAGVSLSYLSFDKNLRQFTYGHGGYFSPQNYIAFSIPLEYRRSYDRIRYVLGGAVGIQDWHEDRAPIFPGHAGLQATLEATAAATGAATFYPAKDETNLGFNIRGQIEYDVNPRTVLGAAASFDNAADWFEVTAGIYLRHFFQWD